jgi:hypothetical protein
MADVVGPSVQLAILFSGLFSLCRGEPASPTAPRADVVLVDATKSAQKGLARHAPRLTVDLRNLDPSSAPADSLVTLPNGRAYAVWNLEGLDVRLPGHEAAGSLESKGGLRKEGSTAPGKGTDEVKDLAWVPRIASVHPGATLNPKVLAARPIPIVGARVALRHGSLETARVTATTAGTPIEFPFLRPGDDPKSAKVVQALASAVRWTDEKRQGPAEIRLYRFGEKKPKAVIRIKQYSDPTDAVVTISNEPLHLHDHGDLVTHWSALYDMLVKPPAVSRRFLPASSSARDKEAGGTNCPPDQKP